MKTLESRRDRVSRLISLAQQDRNIVKIIQGRYILAEIQKRLAAAYSMENMYSNLV